MILRRPFQSSVLFLATTALFATFLVSLLQCWQTSVEKKSLAALEGDWQSAESDPLEPLDAVFRWPGDGGGKTAFLNWPPSGCDAGMWHLKYGLRTESATATRVKSTDFRGHPSEFVFQHESHRNVRIYPSGPDDLFLVTTSRKDAKFELTLTDATGNRQCVATYATDEPALETRAELFEDGVTVFSRGDKEASARTYDSKCRLRGDRRFPSALLSPREVDFRSTHSATTAANSTSINWDIWPRGFLLRHGSHGLSFLAYEPLPLQAIAFRAVEDIVWVAYWTAEHTYLKVLDGRTYETRWSKTLDNLQSWKAPITHVSYVNGMLSVRGSLDAPPWNHDMESTRVYDTTTDTLVANETGETAPNESNQPWPMKWSRPHFEARGHKLDISRYDHDAHRVLDLGDARPTLGIITGHNQTYTWVAHWNDHTMFLYVLESESLDLVFTELIPYQYIGQRPVTHMGIVGDHLSIRGPLDTPPWRVPRDELRVFDVLSGELVATAEVAK